MAVEPRKELQEIKPYVPGKPIEELKRQLGIQGEILKLASNENPLGTSPKAVEAMKTNIDKMYLYPDDECFYLKERLSKHLDVSVENIIIGNGSVELILLSALSYLSPNSEFIMGNQGFAMGKIAAQFMGAKFRGIPEKDYKHNLQAISDAINDKTRIVYIDNPGNPLGTKLSAGEIENFINSIPDNVLVILDEAYYEFVKDNDFPDSLKFVKDKKNVLVLRTFSKIYGLAGLRIGYGIAPLDIINTIRKTRLPFNVNRMAQIAALAALEDDDHIKHTLEINDTGKKYLTEEFDKMGIFYIPSVTNFITIKTKLDGITLFSELQKRGVIIRPLANYGMPEFVRITIGTMKDNEIFIKNLKEILSV
ncbi:MAG: histidinol-phosphate transaminase [Candidatus Cloacimonas sp. 4484_209]|nr:MAG: histidinol-phosphate transaminase [Candidatus Cloacimonas sp. 4484_209]